MLTLRRFDSSDTALISARFNIPMEKTDSMIEEWNSGLFN